MLPEGFAVHGMCISSATLREETSVIGDDVTLGFKIAEFMNKYQVRLMFYVYSITAKECVLCLCHADISEIQYCFQRDLMIYGKDEELRVFLISCSCYLVLNCFHFCVW